MVVTESSNRERINMARGGLVHRKDDREWYERNMVEDSGWENTRNIKIVNYTTEMVKSMLR